MSFKPITVTRRTLLKFIESILTTDRRPLPRYREFKIDGGERTRTSMQSTDSNLEFLKSAAFLYAVFIVYRTMVKIPVPVDQSDWFGRMLYRWY